MEQKLHFFHTSGKFPDFISTYFHENPRNSTFVAWSRGIVVTLHRDFDRYQRGPASRPPLNHSARMVFNHVLRQAKRQSRAVIAILLKHRAPAEADTHWIAQRGLLFRATLQQISNRLQCPNSIACLNCRQRCDRERTEKRTGRKSHLDRENKQKRHV